MQLVVSARLQSWYVICSKIAILQKPCRYLWWNFLNSKFQIHDVLTEVVNLYFCIRKKKICIQTATDLQQTTRDL